MFYTIYQITNLLDGKIYIGKHQTKRLDDGYMGSGKVLRHAIKKYGVQNFKKEILHVFATEAEMNTKEAELVNEEFVVRKDTYNICFGGHGGFGYLNSSGRSNIGWKQNHLRKNSDLARQIGNKGGKALKEKLLDPIAKEEFSLLMKKKHNNKKGVRSASETARANIKLAMQNKQVGPKNSQFGTMWITNGAENRKIKKDLDSIPEGWYKGRQMARPGLEQ